MRSKRTSTFTIFAIFLITILPHINIHAHSLSPFSSDLETLQKQLGYTFKSITFLRRAMTHASFSEENNKAFSIFGANIIQTSVSFNLLSKDVDVSSTELNRRLTLISNVDSSCAVDAMRLGLHKVVRVSPKTNSSSTAVVCGAFRSVFAAIALDTGSPDAAGKVFLSVHGRDYGLSMFGFNNQHAY